MHLLRRAGDLFREVTSEAEWPTYNGEPGGNRYTTLTQIDKTTVTRLSPQWLFSVPDAGRLQVTPERAAEVAEYRAVIAELEDEIRGFLGSGQDRK